jgi:hypothetical protein
VKKEFYIHYGDFGCEPLRSTNGVIQINSRYVYNDLLFIIDEIRNKFNVNIKINYNENEYRYTGANILFSGNTVSDFVNKKPIDNPPDITIYKSYYTFYFTCRRNVIEHEVIDELKFLFKCCNIKHKTFFDFLAYNEYDYGDDNNLLVPFSFFSVVNPTREEIEMAKKISFEKSKYYPDFVW